MTFGDRGEVRAREIVLDGNLRARFRLESPWGRIDVHLGARGAHMVPNALAAAAVGLFLGVPPAGVAAGLDEAEFSPWRMELATSPSGALVLNDSYNANPASMSAALDALTSLSGDGRRVAVLGLMAELGDRTTDEHARVAADAEALGVEVIPVETDLYGLAAVDDVDGALVAVAAAGLVAGDAVLVKGSRVVGLEVVASHLLER